MADQILSQEEVELLLQTLGKEEIPKEAQRKTGEVEPINPDIFEKIAAGRISGLELIFERWTSNLKRALSPIMTGISGVYKEGTFIIKFSEFIQKLPVPSAIGLVSISPLKGSCFLIIDPKIVYATVSSIFGGTTKPYKIEGKEFTRIELKIIEKILKAMLTELEVAWNSVMGVKVSLSGIEINPTLLTVSKPREKVILLKLNFDLENISGFVYLAIPEEAIKPYIELLKGVRENEGKIILSTSQAIKNVPVKIEALLGKTNITLEDLLRLKEGDTITLKRSLKEPIDVKVGGILKFKAVLGQLGMSKAIKIYKYLE